jgi:hypothetical protein
MISRFLGPLVLAMALMFGAIGMANAGFDNGNGNGGINHGRGNGGDDPVPELDPTALGGAIALLLGGVLVLNEGRRKNK